MRRLLFVHLFLFWKILILFLFLNQEFSFGLVFISKILGQVIINKNKINFFGFSETHSLNINTKDMHPKSTVPSREVSLLGFSPPTTNQRMLINANSSNAKSKLSMRLKFIILVSAICFLLSFLAVDVAMFVYFFFCWYFFFYLKNLNFLWNFFTFSIKLKYTIMKTMILTIMLKQKSLI